MLAADENVMGLCRLIICALQSLQKERKSDQAIEDGFMFFLLRRIGAVLKAFVFGEEDECWNNVCAQKDTALRLLSKDDDSWREKRMIKEVQAPYLIWLLDRSMAFFASNCDAGCNIRTSSPAIRSLPCRARHALLSEGVKLQLQNTILKEVMGQDLAEFKNTLNEPQDTRINIEPWSAITRADIVDHFKAEVWRLIGWDCLKGSIEWDTLDDG